MAQYQWRDRVDRQQVPFQPSQAGMHALAAAAQQNLEGLCVQGMRINTHTPYTLYTRPGTKYCYYVRLRWTALLGLFLPSLMTRSGIDTTPLGHMRRWGPVHYSFCVQELHTSNKSDHDDCVDLLTWVRVATDEHRAHFAHRRVATGTYYQPGIVPQDRQPQCASTEGSHRGTWKPPFRRSTNT